MSELYKAFKFFKLLGKFAIEYQITSNYKRYRIDDDYWRIVLVETKNLYRVIIKRTVLFFGKKRCPFREFYGHANYLEWNGKIIGIDVIYELRSAYPYEVKQIIESISLEVPKSFKASEILDLLFSFW